MSSENKKLVLDRFNYCDPLVSVSLANKPYDFHHIIPFSYKELAFGQSKSQQTKINDLWNIVPVLAETHAILHREPTAEWLRKLYQLIREEAEKLGITFGIFEKMY